MPGEAAGYYNDPIANEGYQMQHPQQAHKGQHRGQQHHGNGGGHPGGQQQQQYGGQEYMPPPPSYNQNYGGPGQEKPTFEQTFKVEKPKWNDLWAGALLIAFFAGFVAVSGISISSYSSTYGFQGGGIYGSQNEFGLTTNTVVLFIFCLVVAFVLGFAYVWLARMFTKIFIWVTGILHIVFMLGTAIYMLYRQYWSGGIVFLLFALFAAFCFYTWIPRIPFSVLMFQTVVDASKTFGHVYIVSFLGGLIAAAFGAWFSVTLVAIYIKWEPGNNPSCSSGGSCSSATVIGLVAFVTFTGYWVTEWLKNTIHVTTSGIYAAWFFAPRNSPKGATRGAARRALTYSFGSISFGSLIVAIIQALRQLCSVAQSQSNTGNMAVDCAFCCLRCILGLVEWAVQFINRYAFSYMALYGDSYIKSAKATWKLIKDRGIDALVNECLIGPVMTMGATAVAGICALMAYLYLIFTDPGYNQNGEFTPVVVAYAFLIGLQITNCFTTPLSSGIDTLFVAMAWDPEVLMREHPDLYQKMVHVYPHVQQAIHA